MIKKLDEIFKSSKRIKIDDSSRLVIMSDCHRGAGDNFDNFIKNENIYEAVLRYYYSKNFTYIELGDGDDMWEVKNYKEIVYEHLNTFRLLKKFNDSDRLYMIYGNHDICKKFNNILKDNFYKYYDRDSKKEKDLLNNLKVYESLILVYKGYDIFLIHGHQVDILNGTFWRVSRFLVRHFWRRFERIILKDPTGAAKNYEVVQRREKRLDKWSVNNNKILIAGHTHRPIFPKVGKSLYFNDGSCVHPNGITCLEIENGNIVLVKWMFIYKNNNFSLRRVVLGGEESIINFFLSKTSH